MNTIDQMQAVPTGQVGSRPAVEKPQQRNTIPPRVGNFAELLKKELTRPEAVHFSKHATQRLQSRNIQLTSLDETRLSQGIDRAASKGAQDSLIVLRDLAFIVNVQSRTVVTAVAEENFRESVFTNIDSAVLL